MKLSKVQDKERILKSAREKFQENPYYTNSRFPSRKLGAHIDIFNILKNFFFKEKYCFQKYNLPKQERNENFQVKTERIYPIRLAFQLKQTNKKKQKTTSRNEMKITTIMRTNLSIEPTRSEVTNRKKDKRIKPIIPNKPPKYSNCSYFDNSLECK